MSTPTVCMPMMLLAARIVPCMSISIYTYTVVIATAKNIVSLMDKEKTDFSEPGDPFIIVRKLTKEIIEKAVKAYAENDAYWLKFYHFAGEVDTAVFNRLQAEHTEYLKELDELDNT